MARTVWLATGNPAKAERLRRLLGPLQLDLRSPGSTTTVQGEPDPPVTHLGIACTKAVRWSRLLDGLVVCTDGGVDVPALGDAWQSQTTRRTTGEEASDEERAARLQRRLARLAPEDREAWWVEAIAVGEAGAIVAAWEARGLRGVLTDDYTPGPPEYRGFWVYGMWRFPGLAKHYWDLTEGELQAVEEPWFQLAPLLVGLLRQLTGPPATAGQS